MPGEQALTALATEHAAKPYGSAMGPLATNFRQKVVQWATALTERFQDGMGTITGALGRAIERWGPRIAHLPVQTQDVFVRAIMRGVEWPWLGGVPPSEPCRYGGRRMRNHPDLHLRPGAVWTTIEKLFRIKAARWWDAKGGRRLPMGMHPIRWVRKGDTDDVRITWNMVEFNKRLDPEAATVELETAPTLRHRVQRGDLMGGADLSSGFYHAKYAPGAVTWTGAALARNELPPGVWQRLRDSHPQAHCRRHGKDWMIFVLLGVTVRDGV